jgi:hypothetical protein
MPLDDYGVAVGDFVSFTRDNPNSFGQYFHGHITIRIPNGQGGFQNFQSAIDVNKPDGGVQYFHPTNLDATKFTAVSGMADGYHQLVRNSTSGALDYKRSELINVPLGCLTAFLAVLNWLTGGTQQPWTDNVGTAALDHLESMFAMPANIAKIYLFGAPYPFPFTGVPQGVHDVHCNQGDPPGPFQHLDAIWQDGGVIVKYTDAHLEGFFVKFETQTLNTNDQGLPI